jgi:aminopeptidase YwaD
MHAAHAEPVPVPGEVSSITAERLFQHIRDLPAKRASNGDEAHLQGLREAESQLVGKLKAMGYEPELQQLPIRSRNLPSRKPASQLRKDPPPPVTGSTNPTQPPPPPDPNQSGIPAEKQAEEQADTVSAGVGHSAEPAQPWHNIIIELPGRELSSEVLILTAHFDAVPDSPGADDDGTGVAAVLELARVLKGRPLKRTIRLILFNQEEVGLLGSIRYVSSIRKSVEAKEQTIIGMVTLDMLGSFTDAPNSQRSPIPSIPGIFEPPTVGDFIALATTKKHAPFAERLDREMRQAEPTLKTLVAASFVPDLPLTPRDLLRSDHAPFLSIGLPGVIMTDTSNFRNPHYHQPTDTVETLDGDRFSKVVRAVAAAAIAIAENANVEGQPADARPSEPGPP